MASRALASISSGAVVFVSAAAVFWSAARLDPEPYHDGAQVAPAIAASSGMALQREVFNAYGPITAWLHGAAMVAFGETVLTARLVSAFILILCALLLYSIVRALRQPLWMATLASVLWVLMWPGGAIIWGTPLLPWPSVTFLFFQLSAVRLLLSRLQSTQSRPLLMFSIGVLVALGVFTRPNYGVPLLAATAVAVVWLRASLNIRASEYALLSLGTAFGIALPAGALLLSDAFVPYLDQAIVGPLTGESDATSNITSWFYFENAYLWASLPMILILIILILIGRARERPSWLLPTVTIGAVASLTVWASSALDGSPIRELILSRLTWAPALDAQISQPLFVSAILTVQISISLFLVMAYLIFRNRAQIQNADFNVAAMLVLGLSAAASLAQLFPIADPNHLWWAAPLPLALVFFMFRFAPDRQTQNSLVAVFITATLILAPLSLLRYYSIPRIELKEGVLDGMWLSEDRYDSYVAVNDWFAELQPASAEFSCEQGLFAVWTGEYLADTPSFVNWAHRMDSAETGDPSGRVFRCTYPYDSLSPEEFAEQRGLRIVRTIPSASLSYFSTVRIDEMVPKEQ